MKSSDWGFQAPPNLTPLERGDSEAPARIEQGWASLLAAGINDWGGLSPITRDFVNPEKPWPHISGLAAVTARAGFALLPRWMAVSIAVISKVDDVDSGPDQAEENVVDTSSSCLYFYVNEHSRRVG